MARRTRWLLLAALLLAAWLGIARAGGVPCAQVISRVHRSIGDEHGASVDISRIAKSLGTNPAWVAHCMVAWGKRPKRPGLESAESREAEIESYEEDEPEEVAPEDQQEPGARDRLEYPERPRKYHVHPTPTPAFPGSGTE